MRGDRWRRLEDRLMFLSELPWVIAVYIAALLIVGIVAHVFGGHI
jgi:hypothetical protein